MRFAKFLVLTLITTVFFTNANAIAAVINVPADHLTIQDAIDAAAIGDTIAVANGTYAETLDINKEITIQGASQAGVIINTPDVNDYAIDIQSGTNNVTIQNITLNRPSVLSCTPANTTACYGLKVAGGNGHNLQNITVNGSPRTGIDLHGVDSTLISGVTVNNSTYGAGISITDSLSVTVSNSTTAGNSFGGVAVFTSGLFFPPAGSNLNLSGVNSIGEDNKLYYQKTNSADPITITAPEFNFVILDNTPGTENQGFYTDTLANAITGAQLLETALGNNMASNVVIQDIANPATTYPDTDLLTPGYQSGDLTGPVLDSFTYIARDAADAPKVAAADGKFYLIEGEKIYFTVNTNPADTVGAGNIVSFDIGSTSLESTAFVQSAIAVTERNRNYSIIAGQDGAVSITGLTFKDQAGNDITGLPVFPIDPNIVVDTTAPTITSVTQTSSNSDAAWAKATETITYDITFSEAVDVSVNNASTATNASTLTTEVDASSVTTDKLVFTVQAGDNGVIAPNVDFDITDIAGNTTTITSLGAITGGSPTNTITADTIIPTLDTVTIISDNANTAWAKTADTITINIAGSEILATSQVSATIATETAATTKGCVDADCQNYSFALITDGDETEGAVVFEVKFKDRAQNEGIAVIATTDASSVTFDKTAPTVPVVSITSDNALDTTLAKTNDTVTVTATINDNLSTVISLISSSILSSATTANTMTATGAGKTLSRFTDGTETSEVIAPFSFQVADIAGNTSALITAVTDASSVKFDRTDPVTRSIKISATSADSSAYTGDLPTYYAKQGDDLKLIMHICDYVDSTNNPPTGTLFGQAITMTDQGLVGAPGNCTTGAGNLSQWRNWKAELTNIDGTEGDVTFNVTAKDNAGNQVVNITGTTDSSKVVFDKTVPTNPTDVMDLGGVANTVFKPASDADYTWTNDADPAGGATVSGVHHFDIRYFNPNTGINESVTIDAPIRNFVPASVIPDNDPYEVFMSVVDKAGNASTEATTYTQKYGIVINGTVTEDGSGKPLENVGINVISEFGNECQTGQEICSVFTDANGVYQLVVAPNKDYIVDFLKIPNHYLAKQPVTVTTADVEMNTKLELVEYPEVQASQQTILITTDKTAVTANEPTQILVDSFSGEITTEEIDGKIIVTSFGRIVLTRTNDPDIQINYVGNNTYEIVGAGGLKSTTDLGTQGNTVTTSFASGATKSGTSNLVGGPSITSFNGIRREDRLSQGIGMSYRESMLHAQKMNEGAPQKTNQYVNRNGYVVFSGYQSGTLPLSTFKRFDQRDYIVFRGQKTGARQMQEFANGEQGAPQLVAVKGLFKNAETTGNKEKVVFTGESGSEIIVSTANNRIKNEYGDRAEPFSGYGKKVDPIHTIISRRNYQKHAFDPYYRAPRVSNRAKSRIRPKNIGQIYIKHGSKKVALDQVFEKSENDQTLIVSQ